MMEEYTQEFLCEILYDTIASDNKNDMPFYDFCDKWLPKDYDEHEEAFEELTDIFQQAEQNAFFVGFKAAVKLMK